MSEETKPNVLIVEPDRVLASSLRAAIQISGFKVVEAGDVESALKLVFGGARFHAILVAYLQPRLSGAEFCGLHRSMDDGESAYIVGMSRDHGAETEMLEAGANAFLTKPFSMKVLTATLSNHSHHSSTEEN